MSPVISQLINAPVAESTVKDPVSGGRVVAVPEAVQVMFCKVHVTVSARTLGEVMSAANMTSPANAGWNFAARISLPLGGGA